jgi:AraC-like DNA-binding protein
LATISASTVSFADSSTEVPHAWRGEIVEGNHVVTIQFSDKLLNFPMLEKRLFKQIKELLLESQKGITFSAKTTREVKTKILKLTKTQGFQTVLQFFTILHELSISDRRVLMDNHYDTQSLTRTSKSRRIAKVCDYIEKNYKYEIRLSQVAQLVNMSESAFSHFFKKKTRCTFIDYITNIRIGRVCQMLTETTQTVAEICFSCGFNNQANFIRIFKKKKGCTPSEYRAIMEQMLIKY